jgi:hypothetical protein
MQQLRSDIQEGLSSGEPTPWKPEEIKQDGRKRKASRRAPTQGALAQGAYAVALTIGLRMGCAVFRWGVRHHLSRHSRRRTNRAGAARSPRHRGRVPRGGSRINERKPLFGNEIERLAGEGLSEWHPAFLQLASTLEGFARG